jgi:predicted transcriptional regulator
MIIDTKIQQDKLKCIIELLTKELGVTKSRIIRQTLFSSKDLDWHLKYLIESGVIIEIETFYDFEYSLTEKYLDRWDKLNKIAEELRKEANSSD